MQLLNSWNIIVRTWGGFSTILTTGQKRRTGNIFIFSTLISFADIIGLGSMVPVLMLAIDHSFLEKSRKLRHIYNYFQFSTEASFLKALITVILLFFIVKSLLAMLLQRYVRKTAQDISIRLASTSYDHAFATRSYERISKDGLGFNDAVIFTPYYFVSGVYIPFVTLVSEAAVVLMLTLIFTLYKPVIFLLIVGLLGSGFFLVNRFTRRKITLLGEQGARYREQALREINYGTGGFTDILSYGAVDYFREKMLAPFRGFTVSGIKAIHLQMIPSRINELVALIGIIILVVYAYFFSSDNLGEVRVLAALFAIAIFRLMPAANRMLQSLMHLKLNAYTIDKLSESSQPVSAEPTGSGFNKDISLHNISFAFQGKEPVFTGLNLNIPRGSCIGIKGRSGSGKTTLAKLLLGFYDQYQGELRIDGKACQPGRQASQLFSYVGQDPYILPGTVADNIAFGRKTGPEDQKRLLEALNTAAFRVGNLQGEELLNLQVGDAGSAISEGQKQRLSIARAIYHNSEVIILDEPSSALDHETEKELTRQLGKLREQGKTMIIIAHRDSILEICDQIYQLQDQTLNPI